MCKESDAPGRMAQLAGNTGRAGRESGCLLPGPARKKEIHARIVMCTSALGDVNALRVRQRRDLRPCRKMCLVFTSCKGVGLYHISSPAPAISLTRPPAAQMMLLLTPSPPLPSFWASKPPTLHLHLPASRAFLFCTGGALLSRL